ncbi:epoxyqueuosine reductase QueH [Oscillospiraceae bacterium PP1C4]
MNQNYQHLLDAAINQIAASEHVPTLLLHSCCAPCSSYVLSYLSQYFKITVLYYNPNIYPPQEYNRREAEQKALISALDVKHSIKFLSGTYDTDTFYNEVKGLEQEREGGMRCYKCYALRLQETARAAKDMGFDYFTTTLSVSPHKNAQWINEIGDQLAKQYDVSFLYSDFKKKNGYKTSIELSKKYNLYRQDYCGCIFSQNARDPKNAGD